MTSRLARSALASIVFLLAGCAATSSSPTSTSATDPASGSPTASATAAADLGSQLAQQILRDYNVRNNPAIVASAAGDPTGWKAADTGITLEQDLFGTVDARVNKTLKPASPFDFTPKELIVASPEGVYPRWAVIEFGESERAGGTASPSATASASPADRRVVGVFVQPVADAPWLMENHITVPRPATSVTAREASAAESADARAALQRALDYLTFGREAPEVDLGSIPGSRSSLLIPAKDNIRDTTLVCSTYVPPAGVPGYGNSRAFAVEDTVVLIGSISCSASVMLKRSTTTNAWQRAILGAAETTKGVTFSYVGTIVVSTTPGSRPTVSWWRLSDALAPAVMVRERG